MLAEEVREIEPRLSEAVSLLRHLATVPLPGGESNTLNGISVTVGKDGAVVSKLQVRGVQQRDNTVPFIELTAVQKRKSVYAADRT